MFGIAAMLGWYWYLRAVKPWRKAILVLMAVVMHLLMRMLLGLFILVFVEPPAELVLFAMVLMYGGPFVLGLAYRTRRPTKTEA
jgi:hypothetical protein